ncbi:alpha/beta hydrolase [Formosimonas limnophila]|uniref:Alpha/beta hydrolase n=1 Tax=Formosimonas limnophila TaxID=1384487 RepID=A0A8J3CLT6_9BURK|nr:subtype B tannase [Formosimonas limnophila]GHA65264.1 alpha/beta hydrolase [Formosimonas limnophila]
MQLFNQLASLSLITLPLIAQADTVVNKNDLTFNANQYTSQIIQVNGQEIKYRAYEHIVYVKNPVDTQYQQMNIYIPEAYFANGQIGSYNAQNAPIFLPNSIGGYMPAEPATATPSLKGPKAGKTSTVAYALAHGYVVAAPGARGRTTQNTDGQYTGKAPAAIVDLKAAVRYLRHNDAAMPGNAEKIISNGTSAGGAMSALLGASGNHSDYEPALKALGAANARDDIFAVSAYCPITNLENTDAAYEWQFAGVTAYKKMMMGNMIDFRMERKEVAGTLTVAEIKTAKDLKTRFPGYLNGLKLRDEKGELLTLNAAGNGTFKEHITSLLMSSAQKALNKGTDLSNTPWLTIHNGQVVSVDFDQYVKTITRLKTPPAFDALDLSSGENDLFGTSTIKAQHFTAFGQANSRVNGTSADPAIVKLMNPMSYIGAAQSITTKNWRIRHGTTDRDTSLAISAILATTLKNQGKNVDYALPWNVPHSGDYDLDELFAWIDQISQSH